MFPSYNRRDLYWDGKYVAFTTHAMMHLTEFRMDVREIVDMLRSSFDCPERRKFRREDIERCSRKGAKTFRIIIAEDYCHDIQEECWCIKNVKPI
jgi:hypothetical protein